MYNILNILKKIKDWSNTWVGTITIVLFIMFFIGQHFRIPSGSMKDTLLIGDHVLSKNFAYGVPTPYLPFIEIPLIPFTDGHLIDGDKPQRGDIVIFRYPNDKKKHFVKRCVGIPGDKIFIEKKLLYLHPVEGDEYVVKNYKKEEYIKRFGDLWLISPYMKKFKGIHNDPKITRENSTHSELFKMSIVKVEKYFMMGDNRDHSNDSRFWGEVPYGNIVGKPWFIFFSMGDWFDFRFERFFKTPQSLENGDILNKSITRRIKEDKLKEDNDIY